MNTPRTEFDRIIKLPFAMFLRTQNVFISHRNSIDDFLPILGCRVDFIATATTIYVTNVLYCIMKQTATLLFYLVRCRYANFKLMYKCCLLYNH